MRGIMRSFLIATVVASSSISGAAAQQQPCPNITCPSFLAPRSCAQQEFEHAVCEYRNCLAANQSNASACEGLRHIMDASAHAAGH
jgi:hypothetical protein